jgi:predicted anti-sigma-YlaC factor YlaD
MAARPPRRLSDSRSPLRAAALAGLILLAGAAASGCSLRRLAADRLAAALAEPGTVWTGDDDPVLVGEALPFALKTQESLLAASPDNPELLLATCRGFVSYAAGWIEPAAERAGPDEFEAARRARERALGLHLRALGYCRRALELRLPGAVARLASAPGSALAGARRGDVPLLYWTGAAWGSAVALGLERPELVADLPAVRAIFARALALDPAWERGALHEAMIPLEAVSKLLGGSPERAREHYRRAVELAAGSRAAPHVTWARSVAVAAQDRREFRAALERALAVDLDAAPADRLANRLAQERARILLERADELFYADEEPEAAGGEEPES